MVRKYFLVEERHKEAVEHYFAVSEKVIQAAVDTLRETYPTEMTLSETASFNFIRQNITTALTELLPENPCLKNNMLGCFIRENFAWAIWNGISCEHELESYLLRHPDCQIVDDLGNVLPLEQFEELLRRRFVEP